jgi:2-polyprenyl-6-methoxyphenol hydroxylase-like FAD-dependent oxidoreductase
LRRYEARQPAKSSFWDTDSIDGLPERGFSHPGLQETAFTWAGSQGATVLRPAKAVAFARNGRPSVSVAHDDRASEFAARLVVGADGKHSNFWQPGRKPRYHREITGDRGDRVAGDVAAQASGCPGRPYTRRLTSGRRERSILLFRDVRELSELLLAERDWDRATEEFAVRRRAYYDVILQYDRWSNALSAEEGPEADRRREAHKRAEQDDPTLGGFALIEARGPDGLVTDEAARRRYFGETLA